MKKPNFFKRQDESKNLFYTSILEFCFTSETVWMLSFFPKNLKISAPYYIQMVEAQG